MKRSRAAADLDKDENQDVETAGELKEPASKRRKLSPLEESAFKLIKKLDLTGERAVRSRNFRDHKEVSRAAQRERSSSTMDPADFNKYMDRMVGTEVKGVRVRRPLTLAECKALADVNAVETGTSRSLLHAAVERGDIETVAILCSRGLDNYLVQHRRPPVAVNLLDYAFETPLFRAAADVAGDPTNEQTIRARAMVMILVMAGGDTNQVCRGVLSRDPATGKTEFRGFVDPYGFDPTPHEQETPRERLEWCLDQMEDDERRRKYRATAAENGASGVESAASAAGTSFGGIGDSGGASARSGAGSDSASGV